MTAEGRLLRTAVLASVALHVIVLAFLARGSFARAISVEELRVVAVGTYTPPAPRPDLALPRELEHRRPAPPRPRQPDPGAYRPQPRVERPVPVPVPRVTPMPPPRVAPVAARPAPPEVFHPRPAPVPPVQPVAARPAPAPVSTPPPVAARPAPVRIAQALPRPSFAPPSAPGNSGGRLNLGSASAAGSIPVASGGGTPVGHVPNEGTGGGGSGSGDVPRGRGSAEPAPNPVRTENPGSPAPAPAPPPREPDPVMVTVRICQRSGQLTGPYCAKGVDQPFVTGRQPKRECDICKPPPPPPASEPGFDSSHAESSEPRPKRALQDPDYPNELREAGIEGTVKVEFTIDQNGSVTDIKLSGNKAFYDCVRTAVKSWKFHPAMQGGQPRSFRMSKPFEFRIK